MTQAVATRGAFFWLFQRISGAFLAFFLFMHVKVLHWDFNFAQSGLIDFPKVVERLQSQSMFWSLFYFFFVISALFHGLNGAWAVILDFRPPRKIQLVWLSLLWAVGILVTFWGVATLRSFYSSGGPA